MGDFSAFFHRAVGKDAYGYQKELAARAEPPTILRVPTGCGKTAAAVLTWLWRRQQDTTRDSTPRRLVYCLPMKTLVDQVKESVDGWLDNLNIHGKVGVSVLMGGDADREWSRRPEEDHILIGTQDMLLSRAMNRGYGLPPSAWPIEFGLLNNDCFWVVDEVQLMENGLPTSLQLESLRKKIGTYGKCRTMWMSATVSKSSLATTDFDEDDHDLLYHARPNPRVTRAKKTLTVMRGVEAKGKSYSSSDAKKIFECHRGKPTLIIVNRVSRAQSLYTFIKRLAGSKTRVVLVHSRFRSSERRDINQTLADTARDSNRDIIIVSTQAVEAGVDISSHTLITELAPITSMVQRFGRCNRRGEYEDDAQIFCIDANKSDSSPYEDNAMKKSREWVSQLPPASDERTSRTGHQYDTSHSRLDASSKHDMGPRSASPDDLTYTASFEPYDAVLRRADLLALFDTSPDLSGSYLDVSRFVRHGNAETDILAYWRDIPKKGIPGRAMAKHTRDEICAVPIGEFKEFTTQHKSGVWHYEHAGEDYSENPWIQIAPSEMRPGQIFLVGTYCGGYSDELGWKPDTGTSREITFLKKNQSQNRGAWVSLTHHSKHVHIMAKEVVDGIALLDDRSKRAVLDAALYHDIGKSHYVFQNTLTGGQNNSRGGPWAKSPGTGRTHERKNFRHEVASALAYLEHHGTDNSSHLVAYLIAAHHGKVRMAMRSPVSRLTGPPDGRYLLGFNTADSKPDVIPANRLGDGTLIPKTPIKMGIASVGLQDDGRPSWLSMAIDLRDKEGMGPFKLGYLEALVRAADVRASAKEEESI